MNVLHSTFTKAYRREAANEKYRAENQLHPFNPEEQI